MAHEMWQSAGDDIEDALCAAVIIASSPNNLSEIALVYKTTRTKARRVATVGVTWADED